MGDTEASLAARILGRQSSRPQSEIFNERHGLQPASARGKVFTGSGRNKNVRATKKKLSAAGS